MMRTLLIASALAAAAPAVAQTAMDQGANATPAQPQASTSPTTAPQPAAPQTAAPATTPDSIASIVEAEFPAYDANKDSQLDQSEFSRWMTALKDQEMKSTGSMMAADQLTTWVSSAFSTADKDKSANVSRAELITYLSRGAA